jgi:hypothetical protein
MPEVVMAAHEGGNPDVGAERQHAG